MLDINIWKVTQAEFEQSLQIQKKLEKAGLFNQDEIENTYENCEPVDESFDYLKRGLRNKIKHWIYMTALKKYGKKINRELSWS